MAIESCPECEKAGDMLCVTIRGTRVVAMDENANVRVLVSDPALVAEAREVVEEHLGRMAAVANEAVTRCGIYAHLRDTLALANRPKGGAQA